MAIDLDGDGLETIGIDHRPVLFDHDGDGIRTGTGWLKGDDACLVRDLNGNGIIDCGAEMFGDQTVIPMAQGFTSGKAQSGIDALRALDSNHDGLINAADAAFFELKIWQDKNQNGLTEDGELKTLAQAGIAELTIDPSLAQKLPQAPEQGTANAAAAVQQTSTGRFVEVAGGKYHTSSVIRVTRTDGSSTTATDLSAAHEAFYSQYTTPVNVPDALLDLPDVPGMGRLRNLREAAALSPELAAVLRQYMAADTREAQLALIGEVLLEWAKTDPLYNRQISQNLEIWGVYDENSSHVIYLPRGSQVPGGRAMHMPEPADETFARMVKIMDAVSGQRHDIFYRPRSVPEGKTFATFWTDTYKEYIAKTKNILYEALLPQTRLSPYLQSIRLSIDDTGIQFDFSQLDARLAQRAVGAEGRINKHAIEDLTELLKAQGKQLLRMGWEQHGTPPTDTLRSWIAQYHTQNPDDSSLNTTLHDIHLLIQAQQPSGSAASPLPLLQGSADNDLILGQASHDTIYAGEGHDVLSGGDGDDKLYGNAGDDILLGEAGHDFIHGHDGNDTLIGGAGNDYLAGGDGADTYLFGKGFGQDTIHNYDGDAFKDGVDTIRFEAMKAADISFQRVGSDLLLTDIAGDSVTIRSYFSGKDYQVQRFEFADSTISNPDFAAYKPTAQQLIHAISVFGSDAGGAVSSRPEVLESEMHRPQLVTPAM